MYIMTVLNVDSNNIIMLLNLIYYISSPYPPGLNNYSCTTNLNYLNTLL